MGVIVPTRRTKTARAAATRPQAVTRPTATRAPTTRVARPDALAPKGAAPKGGQTVSKAQQKWSFTNKMPWAHATAKRGAGYRALPDHK